MIYNDFPILNNNDYDFLNQQYSISQTPNRKQVIYTIYKELNNLKNSCFQLENMVNSYIKTSINYTKEIIAKLLDNLIELFSPPEDSTQTISTLSIFSFIKKTSQVVSQFTDWALFENKEYYKSFANKSSIELLECINKFLEALEKSNIKIFKYM